MLDYSENLAFCLQTGQPASASPSNISLSTDIWTFSKKNLQFGMQLQMFLKIFPKNLSSTDPCASGSTCTEVKLPHCKTEARAGNDLLRGPSV